MSECSFPTCSRIEERNGYCFLHKMYSNVPEPPKVKRAIPRVAEKRKEINKVYNKVKGEILSKDGNCGIKSPVCTGKAQGLNHTQKRSPSNLTNPENLVPSCDACNGFIEQHSTWALENGHTISRFATIKQPQSKSSMEVILHVELVGDVTFTGEPRIYNDSFSYAGTHCTGGMDGTCEEPDYFTMDYSEDATWDKEKFSFAENTIITEWFANVDNMEIVNKALCVAAKNFLKKALEY